MRERDGKDNSRPESGGIVEGGEAGASVFAAVHSVEEQRGLEGVEPSGRLVRRCRGVATAESLRYRVLPLINAQMRALVSELFRWGSALRAGSLQPPHSGIWASLARQYGAGRQRRSHLLSSAWARFIDVQRLIRYAL